ncbi:MAG: GNAT family N-acetyltransferase [Clostridiales bacterium]|nr:GNAT family N-acetyltransferase [Clostridiales bacterium]
MDKKNIYIRPVKGSDAQALADIYAPYVKETAISFDYEVPAKRDFKKHIDEILKSHPFLVAEIEGEIVGYAYGGAFRARKAYSCSAETTVYIKKDKRRMGIGKKLYEALEEKLKEQGILNLYACVAYSQMDTPYLTKDSLWFHRRMGYAEAGRFHKCGYKFEQWFDIIWMEKIVAAHLTGETLRF